MASTGSSRPPPPGQQHPVRVAPEPVPTPELTPDASPKPEIPPRRRRTPRHPVPSMQDAFDESLAEHTSGTAHSKPKLRFADPETRRETLLNQAKTDGPPLAEWRRRPGQEAHELRRLLAQICFGVHLLLNGSATTVDSVVQILQGHIDEVDEFLETTLEDIALATADLRERLDHLKLPMDNMPVFERMLEDRGFRLRILDGNETIEHIVSRTTTALMQTARDVSEGLRATQDFSAYMVEQQNGGWRQEQQSVLGIFNAMRGNADGWLGAFIDLQAKGNTLHAVALQLGGTVSQIELKAGEVSRRTRFSIRPFSGPGHTPRSSQSSDSTTRAESPPPPAPPASRIPSSPPRLSLRLSSLIQSTGTEFSYFDIPTKRDTLVLPQRKPPAIEEEAVPDATPTDAVASSRPSSSPAVVPRLETPQSNDDQDNSTSQDNDESEDGDGDGDGPLYLLQPRTYTPQPPAPLPSPRLRVESAQRGEPGPEPDKADRESQPRQRSSLRQRVSLKTNPPESIHVPPLNAPELRRPPEESPQAYQGPDSAYGSDIEPPQRNSGVAAKPSSSCANLPPPVCRRPGLVPSPYSDQQNFRPVQASPHSPLQQRPHTSHTSHSGLQQPAYPHHQRNAPSAMGMSMLGNVTNMSTESVNTKKLKKKRSALGWLKKAFALDEEERALFEQRRRQQQSPESPYHYGHDSPRFLDGRRIR